MNRFRQVWSRYVLLLLCVQTVNLCLNLPGQDLLGSLDDDPTESMVELLVECYGNDRDIMEDDLADNTESKGASGSFISLCLPEGLGLLASLLPYHIQSTNHFFEFDFKSRVLSVVSPPPDGVRSIA